jgi:thiol-disulfide isomerase/thioredoxin
MIRSPASIRMMTASLLFGLAAAITAPVAVAAPPSDSQPELPIDRGLMQRLSNFTLDDVKGKRSIMLYGYQGRSAIVLAFLGNDCPVGNLYVPRLIELEREFRKKGVVFIGINSNAHETTLEVAKFVADRGIEFPVVKDPENKVDRAHLRGDRARRIRTDPLPRRD